MNALNYSPSKEPFYLKGILNLLSYSYSQMALEKSIKKYSRSELLLQHTELKGKKGKNTKLELEDYLRNDLVRCYVQKHQEKFSELKYLHFVPGVDEIVNNITIGSLDLKVLFPTSGYSISGNYLAVEFKRINKSASKKNYYIDEGVKRFIDRKYYPEVNSATAAIVGFMEAEKESHVECIDDLVSKLNLILNKKYNSNVIRELILIKDDLDNHNGVEIFNSRIKRVDNTELEVIHIFLDYYNLIEQ